MSGAAEFVRVNLLRSNAEQARERARSIWLTAQVARGMYGVPLFDAEAEFRQACEAADRWTLEYRAAL